MTQAPVHGTVTGWPADWAGSAVTPVGVDTAFNGYLAAQIIFSLDRLGVLDRLLEGSPIGLGQLATDTGADRHLLDELMRAAAACGYVRVERDSATMTAAGREMARMRGYFTWAVGGYSNLFSNIAGLVRGERRFNGDIFRDEAMVALGSGQNDRSFMAGTVDSVLAGLDFGAIADLGSGISARVCRVAGGREHVRGIGIDISPSATRLAEQTIERSGLSGRVRAVQADVMELARDGARDAGLAEVDVVMSFFLLHDLLASPGTRSAVLPGLRAAFPGAHTFVLADTLLRPAGTGPALPVFSVGYELAHALMGVPLHTQDTYEALFAQAGLHARQAIPFGTPHSWLYVLEAD